jgi:hypothetical protein
MANVYKIHPSIGIMRVGDHPTAFFIGPEEPGSPGVELTGASETKITAYKSGGQLKRQAARFRVWEYDQDASGKLTPVREVTSKIGKVEWKVELVNKKAAGNSIVPLVVNRRQVLVPTGPPRNGSVADRDRLIIRDPRVRGISGENQPPVAFDQGQFLGRPVYLGELRTDSLGRLIALGGRGKSEGIPSSAGGPVPPLSVFDNNDGWHDDVSDGPVSAMVTIGALAPVPAVPAWAVCAPPDFAPGIGGVSSLYEVALQAAFELGKFTPPAVPSFRRDIFPTLARSLGLRWVHQYSYWNDDLPQVGNTLDGSTLSDASAANGAQRQKVYNVISQPNLFEFAIPAYCDAALRRWVAGSFVDDWSAGEPALGVPEQLDRASLLACIGSNFFPGIEAGFVMTKSDLYLEALRFDPAKLNPGDVTAAMALPWQADFNDCSDNWWPSQRPNNVFASAGDVPGNPVAWADGVYSGDDDDSRLQMVKLFAKLGFIVPAGSNFLESERDSSLPTR